MFAEPIEHAMPLAVIIRTWVALKVTGCNVAYFIIMKSQIMKHYHINNMAVLHFCRVITLSHPCSACVRNSAMCTWFSCLSPSNNTVFIC